MSIPEASTQAEVLQPVMPISTEIPQTMISNVLENWQANFSASPLSHYIDFHSIGWVLFALVLMVYLINKEQWVKLKKQLEEQAMQDQLTDLPNRRFFEIRAAQILKTTQRQGRPFAIMIADLDNFKLINDSLGHHAGDIVLKELAERFTRVVRGDDMVARLGGDEFAFVIQNTDKPGDVDMILQRLYGVLELPVAIENRTFNIGMSFGVALYENADSTVEGLLRRADISLYRAKVTKNTYQIYTNEDDEILGLNNIARHNDLRRLA